MATALTLILKPFFMLLFFGLVACIKVVLDRVISDGKIKRALFRERGKKPARDQRTREEARP